MTCTLDAVRNSSIPTTAPPHAYSLESQFFRRPSEHARVSTSNLFDVSHSRNLEKINRVAARPSARVFNYAEHSKPYTYGLPCLTTCRQHMAGKERHRSVIARCEMEWKGGSPEQTPGHEEQECNKREHAHSDHTPGCERCDGELREWKGAKDARREQIGMQLESEWQNEEDSWHPEYTPRHGGGEDKGRVSSTLSVADKVIKIFRFR